MNFSYKTDRYILGVLLPMILALYFTVINLIKLTSGNGTVLNQLFFVFCLIAFIDYALAISNPREIEINDEVIIVHGTYRKHVYKKSDLEKLLVRRFYNAKKIYVRIGRTNLLKGRYWINLEHYNQSEVLLKELLKIEDELHPMLIKFEKRSTRRRKTV